MDEEQQDVYDVIIVGSGVKECLLGLLLSCVEDDSTVNPAGGIRKVLQIGGFPTQSPVEYGNSQNRTLTLQQLMDQPHIMHKHTPQPINKHTLQQTYICDATPFITTQAGTLYKLIQALGITQYTPFSEIENLYCCLEANKVCRVPVQGETSALALLEKARFNKFASWIRGYNQNNSASFHGLNATQVTARAVFKKFKLDPTTQLMIGHCMAGYATDSFLDDTFYPTLVRIQEYLNSAAISKEPSTLVAPQFGTRGLIETLVRKGLVSNVHFLLEEEFEDLVFNDQGSVAGIRCTSGRLFAGKFVVCVPEVLAQSNRVINSVHLSKAFFRLKTPALGTTSGHILFPSRVNGSQSDLHVTILGDKHLCAPKDHAIASVSTFSQRRVQEDIQAAIDFFASNSDVLQDVFTYRTPVYETVLENCEPGLEILESCSFVPFSFDMQDELFRIFAKITRTRIDVSKIQYVPPHLAL